MSKIFIPICAIAAAAIALSLSIGFASSARIGKISITGIVAEHHLLSTAPGGTETWRFALSSVRAVNRKFGYGILSCTYVSRRTSIKQCTGTYALPQGKLTVAGSFLYPQIYSLSVTGGTGIYRGSRGGFDALRESPGVYALTFVLD